MPIFLIKKIIDLDLFPFPLSVSFCYWDICYFFSLFLLNILRRIRNCENGKYCFECGLLKNMKHICRLFFLCRFEKHSNILHTLLSNCQAFTHFFCPLLAIVERYSLNERVQPAFYNFLFHCSVDLIIVKQGTIFCYPK